MVNDDIKGYTAAVMPTSVVTTPTPDVGGGPSYTVVDDAIVGGTIIQGVITGEVFAMMPSTILGGGSRFQSAKWFVTNTHATDDAVSMLAWGMTLDDSPGGTFKGSCVSDSEDDDGTHIQRFLGYNSAGAPYSEDVPMNGLTPIFTVANFTRLIRGLNFDSITGALKPSAGNRTFSCGATPVGLQLKGFESITSEITWGLVGSLNDTGTADDANTAPDGITLAKPRTMATAIPFANDGVLTHLAGQGVWEWWELPELLKFSPDFQIPKVLDGSSFS